MKKILLATATLSLVGAGAASAQSGRECVYRTSHEDGAVTAAIYAAAKHMAEVYGQRPVVRQPLQLGADGLYHASFTHKGCEGKMVAVNKPNS